MPARTASRGDRMSTVLRGRARFDERYRAPALDKGLDMIEVLAEQPGGLFPGGDRQCHGPESGRGAPHVRAPRYAWLCRALAGRRSLCIHHEVVRTRSPASAVAETDRARAAAGGRVRTRDRIVLPPRGSGWQRCAGVDPGAGRSRAGRAEPVPTSNGSTRSATAPVAFWPCCTISLGSCRSERQGLDHPAKLASLCHARYEQDNHARRQVRRATRVAVSKPDAGRYR